ncbi:MULTISPECIES: CdaR family transcriptional regulator [Lactobacillus]|uniref:PucR C-terminal helix-turn-helix domain-containing protein n=1 Tax=Lactobacillus xujianguonis TaxID=2495899 RepID=A0A437SV96_9LACO|nr:MULTISPECIES: helix-turn-helix domain-containing protein [Lactobacillus]RVU70747.1 hypothetical protein EJK17_05740 [Lactobacillus xujianguonis]RVU73992.1 hypothetical protein EJK20_05475 [Lactobacillus xujianguonis]
MELNKIKALFPTAKLQPEKDDTEFSFPYQNQWLVIPKISDREKDIINALLAKPLNQHQGPWQQYLQSNGNKPEFTGKVRFLFFACTGEQEDHQLWLEAIKNMFNTQILASFALKEDNFCLVEQYNEKTSYSADDFIGIVQTVADDTGIDSRAYIGHPWPDTEQLVQYFNEESYLFQEEITNSSSSVITFSNIALPFFTKKALRQSNIIRYYHKEIIKDKQLPEIIKALYKNQGNISSTAKDLYLHRNTLMYHIDKVKQQLGLDLKQMDDLLLAYLAII